MSERPSRTALFLGYLQIGLTSFGGVNAWARRFFVEKKGWLTEQEYAEVLGIGQVLPGPNALNTAIGIGTYFHGATGAIVCALGLFTGPMVLLAAVASLYDTYGQLPLVRAILTGIAAAAAGMVMGTAVKMVTKLRPSRTLLCIGLAAFTLAALKVRMPYVLLMLAPLGLIAAWRELDR
ncbi:chromate transporter [Roseococcus pinisoli]|uniref:Chromate transporter n=1 Tax=Roseococcus pinisoli TaxID=2835040 RepID=A0ABS5QE23_9PROT|nr:chromate transporter [Roseococcus pinisoli]